MSKNFKSLVGQTIYLIPTGNNVYRRTPIREQILEATLLRVGKLTITTNFGTYKINGEYNNRYNCGYIHFESKQLAEEYFLKDDIENYIKDIFRHKTELTYSTLQTIKQLIDKELK